MLGIFVTLALRLGVAERYKRLAGSALAVGSFVTLLGLLWGGWHLWLGAHDRGVVAADVAGANAEISNRTIIADRAAGADKRQRDDVFTNDQQQKQERIDDAARNDSSPLDALFGELRRHP